MYSHFIKIRLLLLLLQELSALELDPYIGWPIKSADIGQSQMYQYQRICCTVCTDVKTFLFFFFHNVIQKKILGIIYNRACKLRVSVSGTWGVKNRFLLMYFNG